MGRFAKKAVFHFGKVLHQWREGGFRCFSAPRWVCRGGHLSLCDLYVFMLQLKITKKRNLLKNNFIIQNNYQSSVSHVVTVCSHRVGKTFSETVSVQSVRL